MGEYDRAIASVLRSVAKKGRACTWVIPVAAEGEKSWKSGPAQEPINNAVRILFLPSAKGLEYLFQTEVPVGSEIGLMGAVPFVPALSHIVDRVTDELKPSTINPLAPNGQVILYAMSFTG